MAEPEISHAVWELHAAIDSLQGELEGEVNSQRARAIALDHVRTAMLLLMGSETSAIVGHPRGSLHHPSRASTDPA